MKRDWQNMSDKELDDFFRHRAGQPEIPFEPADWEKMRAKLDKPTAGAGMNGKSGYWYRIILISGLVALLLLGGGVWIGAQYGKKDGEVSEKVGAIIPEESSKLIENQSDMVGGESGKVTLHEIEDWPTASVPEREKESGMKEGLSKQPPKEEAGIPPENNNEMDLSNNSEEDLGLLDSDHSLRIRRSSVLLENRAPSIDQLSMGNWEERKNGIGPAMEWMEKKGNGKMAPPEKQKDFWNGSRLALSLMLSPDVSALKIQDVQGLGTSAGLGFSYLFAPRWSVHAGALYSFKTYQGGEGYQVGYGPNPLGVKGNCWVLDIPVNVRYYGLVSQLDRWFVSTGLSSYWMLREEYTLSYENNAGEPYSYEVQVRNENKHYLGVLNLSFGYERMLTNRLSLQVEPYLKLPLSDIGEGQVGLKSAGALIGIQYNW